MMKWMSDGIAKTCQCVITYLPLADETASNPLQWSSNV